MWTAGCWRARSSAPPAIAAWMRRQGPRWEHASSGRRRSTAGRSAPGRASTTTGKSSDLHRTNMNNRGLDVRILVVAVVAALSIVARVTLIILIIMSIGSWYIGAVKVIEQARVMKDAREANSKFWSAGAVKDGVLALREDSAFRFIAEEGQIAVKDHSALARQQLDLNSWVAMSLERAIDVINNRLQTGLAFLATVGSTAPFVGLFGTV